MRVTGHECYHCKQWVESGEAHDCWTTTENALTADLSEDLRDAYERLRETATEFGDQRIYASHSSIMFSRKACYFFVRPKRSFLEVCVFLPRLVTAPQIRKSMRTSKVKTAHIIQVRHRDEVEPPLTDWLREAYAFEDAAASSKPSRPASSKPVKLGKLGKPHKPARADKPRKRAKPGKVAKPGKAPATRSTKDTARRAGKRR
jgi:hypothetical protein